MAQPSRIIITLAPLDRSRLIELAESRRCSMAACIRQLIADATYTQPSLDSKAGKQTNKPGKKKMIDLKKYHYMWVSDFDTLPEVTLITPDTDWHGDNMTSYTLVDGTTMVTNGYTCMVDGVRVHVACEAVVDDTDPDDDNNYTRYNWYIKRIAKA